MAVSYKPDHKSMRDLANSSGMSKAMQQVADVGKRWAESNAPNVSGDYAGAFRVEPATLLAAVRGGVGHREERAGAVLSNDAPHAGAVEGRTGLLARSVSIMEGHR